MWKFRSWQGLLMGIGIGVVGSVIWPRLLARAQQGGWLTGITGALATGSAKLQYNVRRWTDAVKDEAQDLVAEAQYEKVRQDANHTMNHTATQEPDDRLPLS